MMSKTGLWRQLVMLLLAAWLPGLYNSHLFPQIGQTSSKLFNLNA